MLKVLSISLILLGLSCSYKQPTSSSQPAYQLNNSAFKAVGKESVKVRMTGNGTVVSTSFLSGWDSNHNYQLKFILKENGSLRLISHAQATQENGRYTALKGGLDIVFARAGKTLRVNIDGKELEPSQFSYIDASGEITIHLDVHNDAEHATESHIIFMPPNSEPLHFNSRKPIGNAWGLELFNAEVSDAVVGEAKDKH